VTASHPLWTLLLYAAFSLVIVAGMLLVSWLLGQQHRERATAEPYEGGMPVTGEADVRLSIKFYLVAMFFVVFDLEAVFIIVWAIAAAPLGWRGYFEMLFFVVLLLAALVYLWRLGALDWGDTAEALRLRYNRPALKSTPERPI
jgi:NADH-quinone oxidoreductase subunit A